MKKYFLYPTAFLLFIHFISCSQNQDEQTNIEDIIGQMTLEEKIQMLSGYNRFSIRPLERLGIPEVKLTDGPLGIRSISGKATAFPASIALAASWNKSLVTEVGAAIASEAKEKGKDILLAPGMNIYRAPMNGRNFEYFGEDPFLAGQIAVAYISGVQQEGIIATAKHFVANNQEFDRHFTGSNMDERTLHEIYLPAFKACVEKGKVGAVMTSYNPINGIHASENKYLISDILKDKWQFDGFVISDWTSTYSTVGTANAGLDLEMPEGRYLNVESLLPAIENGVVTVATIDDKIRRMLKTFNRFKLLEPKQSDYEADIPHNQKIALKAARGSIVLLKNEKAALPIKDISSIAILGPNAHPAVFGGGGSSVVAPLSTTSVLDGFKKIAPDLSIHYDAGVQIKLTEEIAASSMFFTEENGTQVKGLKGEYFSNMELEGKPDFTRIDETVFYRWIEPIQEGFPKDFFSIRWTGKLKVQDSGTYKFMVSGDDGFRLFLDEKEVINAWRDQAETQRDFLAHLEAEKTYKLRLEYYENQGGAAARIGYYKVGSTKRAEDMAAKSDAAVVCVGFNAVKEAEASDRTFAMSDEQVNFINKIASVNPKTFVVLFGGGNIRMTDFKDNVQGILHSWYPGQEGGQAVAEIILGNVNPSGKLPVSFEREWEDNPVFENYYDADGDKKVEYKEGLFIGYRYYDLSAKKPLFPFGYGLSYTTFEYKNLEVSEWNASTSSLSVSVEITNIGEVEGAEVVQLYVRDLESSVERPLKELKGFEKVLLKPSESKKVTLILKEDAFSFYDVKKHDWVLEAGEFEILTGSSSQDIRLSSIITIN